MKTAITIMLICVLAGCNAIERHETRSAAKQAREDYHKAIEPHHTAYRLAVINATPEQKAAARQASDHERMDALLEKISEQGIHSLTPAERKELEALRERRRKGRWPAAIWRSGPTSATSSARRRGAARSSISGCSSRTARSTIRCARRRAAIPPRCCR